MTNVRLKKILLLFAAGSLMLAGCSDDDPIDPTPEDADDNFITSVVLTVGETSYAAEIADNNITVTVPYNVSLDGATAEFEYTPSATIMPDPAEITDWDTERQFRVTSYNGATNDYKYLIVKDDIRSEGDVVLKTDAEVEAFADKGVTIIKGDLIIGEESGNNSVTSIEALSALTAVEGDIVINNTYAGIALDGLENVVKIGGLRIGSTEAEKASTAPELYYASLKSLEEVTGDVVVCNDKVQWFEAERLTAVGGSLIVRSEALTSITTPVLATIGGDFELQGSNTGKSGGDMTTVEMNALATVGGEITIKNLAKLNAVKFGALTRAGAILLPTIPYEFETISLPVLSEVGGDIQFIANTDETAIGGATMNTGLKEIDMNSLTRVDGTISLSAFTELTALPALAGVTVKGIQLVNLSKFTDSLLDLSGTIFSGGGQIQFINMNLIETLTLPRQTDAVLELRYCNLVSKVDGVEELAGLTFYQNTPGAPDCSFPALKIVRGDVGLTCYNSKVSIPLLERVDGNLLANLKNVEYPKLTEVGGYLAVPSVGGSVDFSSLSKIGGQFYFDATNIFDPINMPVLEEVGTAANPAYYREGANDKYYADAVYGSCALVSYDGLSLPKLRKIGGAGFTLDLGTDDNFISEVSLPALEEVDGLFQIHHNGWHNSISLESIALPVIVKIGSVHIQGCTNLTDFSAFLPVIGQLNADTWFVHEDCGYSPSYADMVAGNASKQ